MICRLCLASVKIENSVLLFDPCEGDEVETQLIKLIAKYLQLEITKNDDISTIVCSQCSNQLIAFNTFCEHVEQQQSTLSNKFIYVEFNNSSDLIRDVNNEVLDPMELQLKCEPEDETFYVAEENVENQNKNSETTLSTMHLSILDSGLSSSNEDNQMQNQEAVYGRISSSNSTIRMKIFREKLKEDKQKYEEYLQKERERSKLRRLKQKLALNAETLAQRRLKDRTRQRIYREKKFQYPRTKNNLKTKEL